MRDAGAARSDARLTGQARAASLKEKCSTRPLSRSAFGAWLGRQLGREERAANDVVKAKEKARRARMRRGPTPTAEEVAHSTAEEKAAMIEVELIQLKKEQREHISSISSGASRNDTSTVSNNNNNTNEGNTSSFGSDILSRPCCRRGSSGDVSSMWSKLLAVFAHAKLQKLVAAYVRTVRSFLDQVHALCARVLSLSAAQPTSPLFCLFSSLHICRGWSSLVHL